MHLDFYSIPSLLGFFSLICAPLFRGWYQFFGSQLSKQLCDNIEKNKAYWEDKAKELEIALKGQNISDTAEDKEEEKEEEASGETAAVEDTKEPVEAATM